MTATSIILIVLGAPLLALSLWERAGRSVNARSWVGSPGLKVVHMALFVRPGAGLTMLAFGLFVPFGDVPVVGTVLAFLVPIGAIILFWGILRLPIPSWWLPSFAKARWAADKARERGE